MSLLLHHCRVFLFFFACMTVKTFFRKICIASIYNVTFNHWTASLLSNTEAVKFFG